MTPCTRIYYLYYNLRALPKSFKEEGLYLRRSASGLDQLKLNGLSIDPLKLKYEIGNETSYTLKFIR